MRISWEVDPRVAGFGDFVRFPFPSTLYALYVRVCVRNVNVTCVSDLIISPCV